MGRRVRTMHRDVGFQALGGQGLNSLDKAICFQPQSSGSQAPSRKCLMGDWFRTQVRVAGVCPPHLSIPGTIWSWRERLWVVGGRNQGVRLADFGFDPDRRKHEC